MGVYLIFYLDKDTSTTVKLKLHIRAMLMIKINKRRIYGNKKFK
jgi:hypothetical protein